MFIFGAGGEELVTIDLEIERDITTLQTQLKRFLPDSDIQVEIISDNIVLSGTVRTPQDASQAERLAQIFVTGGEATPATSRPPPPRRPAIPPSRCSTNRARSRRSSTC